MTNNVYSAETAKKLRRSRDDRMLSGVCAGWARYLGVDVTLVRVVLVAATFFGLGATIPIYLAAWILTPEEQPAA
jgi:phage shock protein PspC (stress-responsive transcriptional regulator)